MSNETAGNGGATEQREFALQKIYIKDFSFEAPNTPAIFANENLVPEVELNLKSSHTALDDTTYEVVLHVNVHAKNNEETMFMTEVDQAGMFHIAGYDEDEMRQLIGAYCPSTLFPFVREVVSEAVGKGGFPSILLQPINFDALFAQVMRASGANKACNA